MRNIDFRWVSENALGVEVISGGVVIIHQRDHLPREEWKTMIVSADELRALARLIDENGNELTAPQESGSSGSGRAATRQPNQD